MSYSKNPPKTEGHYWVKGSINRFTDFEHIVHVYHDFSGRLCVDIPGIDCNNVEQLIGVQWCGPIDKPHRYPTKGYDTYS